VLADARPGQGSGAAGSTSAASAASPGLLGGPWPRAGAARAPLGGFDFSGNQAHAGLANGGAIEEEPGSFANASGTMITRGDDAVGYGAGGEEEGGEGDASATMVVAQGAEASSSDYLAALRRVVASDDGGCAAAWTCHWLRP
jgi:hypothetical protein